MSQLQGTNYEYILFLYSLIIMTKHYNMELFKLLLNIIDFYFSKTSLKNKMYFFIYLVKNKIKIYNYTFIEQIFN